MSRPALSYGCLSILLVMFFVVWPLTQDCRQRVRSRRQRRRYQHDDRITSEAVVESDSLIPIEIRDYGTGDNTT
jgi:hypothetical protein